MQIYALDPKSKQLVSVANAQKGQDYRCPECSKSLRLRGGKERTLHFYHLDLSLKCRQNQKSLTHLKIQEIICHALPHKAGRMEVRFPTISRIADVVWHSQKLVYEIQCSPISSSEVLNRNQDYASVGYRVVWIFHDKRFNKYRVSPPEISLSSSPHYYTNINEKGVGFIYDQYSDIQGSKRIFKSSPLLVDLASPCLLLHPIQKQQFPRHLYHVLKERKKRWRISFKGDLLDDPPPSYAIQKRKKKILLPFFRNWILRPYLMILHTLLEKVM